VVCPRGTLPVFIVLFTCCLTETEWDGEPNRRMWVYCVCVCVCVCVYTHIYTHTFTHTHTHTHRRVFYLIWFGHVITCIQSGKGVLLLAWCWKLENKVVIATDRLGFSPWKERRHNVMANQERKCYYIDMLNHMCDNVTPFKVLVKTTGIFSSSVLDISELFLEYK
jgi:hypothetical protein